MTSGRDDPHRRGVVNGNRRFVSSHAPFEQLAATTNGLISARGAIAGCHAALVETRKTIPGLRTVAIGDEECPPQKGHADLRVVA